MNNLFPDNLAFLGIPDSSFMSLSQLFLKIHEFSFGVVLLGEVQACFVIRNEIRLFMRNFFLTKQIQTVFPLFVAALRRNKIWVE